MINNSKVVLLEDYQSGTAKDLLNDKEWNLEIPKSNVLIYYTEDGSKIACRPSGTEPKIKFYISVKDSLNSIADFEKVNSELDIKIAEISNDLKIH